MTKSEQAQKDLLAEQKKNYEEMSKMIGQVENPTKLDVKYLEEVMSERKYNRDNRTELTRLLVAMRTKLEAPKNAVTFGKTESPKEQKPAPTTATSKPADDLMSDRAEMFREIREELFVLAEKCVGYSRKQVGGAALRLNNVASNLTRLAKQTLRE